MWDVADDVLLASFAVGDPRRGRCSCSATSEHVFGLARSIVDDRVLAEDLAQEAFDRDVAACRRLGPRRGSVESWLLTIARDVALDARRSRRYRRRR